MSTLDNGPDDGLVVSESESTERIKAITEKTIEDLDDLKIKIFETITGPESINAKNVRAITRELFEKILKGEDLSQYSLVISYLNQKFSKIWDDFKKTKNPQNIQEYSMAFGLKDTTTLSALLQGGNLQKVLAGPDFYMGNKPYVQAVKDTFKALFPGEELLIKKSPKEILQGYGIDIDHYNPDTAKTILESHAKKQTLDSLKQNYFGKRLQIIDDWKEINSTTKEKVSYVIIDNKDYYSRETKQFNDPVYGKQVLEDLRGIYLSEEIAQVNKQLKAAGIENTID